MVTTMIFLHGLKLRSSQRSPDSREAVGDGGGHFVVTVTMTMKSRCASLLAFCIKCKSSSPKEEHWKRILALFFCFFFSACLGWSFRHHGVGCLVLNSWECCMGVLQRGALQATSLPALCSPRRHLPAARPPRSPAWLSGGSWLAPRRSWWDSARTWAASPPARAATAPCTCTLMTKTYTTAVTNSAKNHPHHSVPSVKWALCVNSFKSRLKSILFPPHLWTRPLQVFWKYLFSKPCSCIRMLFFPFLGF